jgi:hypothetical protein
MHWTARRTPAFKLARYSRPASNQQAAQKLVVAQAAQKGQQSAFSGQLSAGTMRLRR